MIAVERSAPVSGSIVSAVVHELQHAQDDTAAAGPTLVSAARDQNELRAYRRQGRFLLDARCGSDNRWGSLRF